MGYGDTGSVEDLLEKSKGGTIVAVDDVKELADAIINLANNPQKSVEMDENNRRYTETSGSGLGKTKGCTNSG